MPELARVRGVSLPISPRVERKDKDGNPVMDIAGKTQEKDGFVKQTFQPWEPIAYRW